MPPKNQPKANAIKAILLIALIAGVGYAGYVTEEILIKNFEAFSMVISIAIIVTSATLFLFFQNYYLYAISFWVGMLIYLIGTVI